MPDESLFTQEHKKTDNMAKKFELPLDDFEDLKHVCTNFYLFLIQFESIEYYNFFTSTNILNKVPN